MAERKIEHRKSCLVLSARFLVVNGRSRPVAKSAYCIESHLRFKNTNDNWFEYDSTKTIVYDFTAIAFIPKSLQSTVQLKRNQKAIYISWHCMLALIS